MTNLEQIRRRAEIDAKTYGYYLHPDPDFLKILLEGLEQNEDRYGYPSCPCRLASGKFEFDRDIICPCDYRDPDVLEFGFCYCALYVRKDVHEGKTPITQIPERRPLIKQSHAYRIPSKVSSTMESKEGQVASSAATPRGSLEMKLKLWYCKQCGYTVFREDPPYICPICKANREMFAEIKICMELIG